MTTLITVVVPTIGRPSLAALLDSLVAGGEPQPTRIVVVDDRPDTAAPLVLGAAEASLADRLEILRSGGRGPAAARNVGWLRADTEWVAFLDDDVLATPGWCAQLAADLDRLGDDVAASQGRVFVPLPEHRRPTDWERGTAGLASARWITADMAYRRSALAGVGGFDERFRRAFREDSDLALRVVDAGWRIVRGSRTVTHPVRPAGPLASLHAQRGNADDALMRRLHGPTWYSRAGAEVGRRPRHLAVTAAALAAVTALATGHRRIAAVAGAAWLAGTAEFAAARIAPGPRTGAEVRRMLATSAAIPPAAVWHWLRGTVVHRRAQPWAVARPVRAVLLDRDDTIVRDVPYNGDPDRVEPVPGAREALDRLRAAGLPLGVVSNQSGIARGLLDADQVQRVNERVDKLLGPFDTWQVCPHADDDRCGCRKPAPGMLVAAARELDVPVEQCALIGDIGADMVAARRAGALGILVPTAKTKPDEVAAAPAVAPTLTAAVDQLLGRAGGSP